jgi:hypothetical protein
MTLNPTTPFYQNLEDFNYQQACDDLAKQEVLFQRTKHKRILEALADAADLNIKASVSFKERGNQRGGLCYCFDFECIGWGMQEHDVNSINEGDMALVERALDEVRMQIQRECEQRKAALKKQVLARLSKEEREALGL